MTQSATHPGLGWLRLPPGGKAATLNAALLARPALVLTADADTLLDRVALATMRRALAADPTLVAAIGVLSSEGGTGAAARTLQGFQRCEYVCNFPSRAAWTRADGLLLISEAFACSRCCALLAVGGFDPDRLVEDHELTQRLRDHAVRTGQPCHTAVSAAHWPARRRPARPAASCASAAAGSAASCRHSSGIATGSAAAGTDRSS